MQKGPVNHKECGKITKFFRSAIDHIAKKSDPYKKP